MAGMVTKGTRPCLRWSMVLVILMALTIVVPVVLAQEATPATPTASATVVAAPPWRAELVPRPRPLTVTLGTSAIQVEIANNDAERALGLGERDGLLPDTGMLFAWDTPPEVRYFWMGGMRFCLDIIFLDHGRIIGATENACPGPPGGTDADVPRQTSPAPAEYVLEVPAGYLAAHGYGVGTPYSFSTDPHRLPTPVPVSN